MSRRLLIADRYEARALQEIINRQSTEHEWDILLLGLSNGWFHWKYRHAADGPSPWRLVDPVPHLVEANERVGAFLVDLVARLPQMDLAGETLGGLLDRPEGSLWWFLEMTEKGPFRGPLVTQLYLLAMARSVIERGGYAGVSVAIADGPLADVFRAASGATPPVVVHESAGVRPPWWDRSVPIRYWLHALVVVGRLAAIRLLLALWGSSVRATTPGGVAAFTFYPAWWARPFSGEAADRFFSDRDGLTGYLAWFTSPRALWRYRRQAAAIVHARSFRPLQSQVRLTDVLEMLSPGRFARVMRFERRLRPAVRAEFAGVEVGSLIGAELSRSMSATDWFLGPLIARAVCREVAVAAPRTVLYRLEFQPLENAVVRGLRGQSRAVGFLHYPFGRNYLSTRFAPGEVAQYLRGEDPRRDRPLPDGVIACGPVGIDHVAEGGYPRSRCAECGPQRFGRLLEYRRTHKGRAVTRAALGLPLHRRIYVVTLAIVEEDTEALFGALAGALDRTSDDLLVVRPHPNRPQGDPALTESLSLLGTNRAILMDSGQDLYDHIVAADALVCIGSMIAFEAMALDRMPVAFDNPSSFAALSLGEFDDALFIARDDRDLHRALHAIGHDTDEVRAKRRHWPAMLGRVLGDLDTPLPAQLARALSHLENR